MNLCNSVEKHKLLYLLFVYIVFYRRCTLLKSKCKLNLKCILLKYIIVVYFRHIYAITTITIKLFGRILLVEISS